GISAALTATLVSHATAIGSLKDIVLDFAHVLSVSVWSGGVVALLWCVLLVDRDERANDARALGATVLRFSLTALVAIAILITAFAPPAQLSAAAFDQTQHVSGLRLEMLIATGQPGRNRFVLRVHQGLAPVTGVEKVAFRFTMVEHDMGEQELVAAERAPG